MLPTMAFFDEGNSVAPVSPEVVGGLSRKEFPRVPTKYEGRPNICSHCVLWQLASALPSWGSLILPFLPSHIRPSYVP